MGGGHRPIAISFLEGTDTETLANFQNFKNIYTTAILPLVCMGSQPDDRFCHEFDVQFIA